MDPVYVSKTVPVMEVRCRKSDQEMVINVEDYDPKLHKVPKKANNSSASGATVKRERIRSA